MATLTLAGTGYNTPPNVTIGNVGNGTGGIVTTSIMDGGVVTLNIVNGGSGYDSTNVNPPTITIDAPPTAIQFVNDEHVVIGGFTSQGSGRTWTSANKVITVTALGSFDPTFATTTQKKYFYWKFEDKRISYVYQYNGTTATTTPGFFYYDSVNVKYIINAWEDTSLSLIHI